MTGACLGDYSDNGIARCMVTVPWWVVFLLVALAVAVAAWRGLE